MTRHRLRALKMNKTSWKRVTRRGREAGGVLDTGPSRRPCRWYQLAPEGLEDRVMLSQDTWINPAGGIGIRAPIGAPALFLPRARTPSSMSPAT
jgi:hypothetical protein